MSASGPGFPFDCWWGAWVQRSRRGRRPAPPRVLNEQRGAAFVDLPPLALPFDTKGIHLSVHPSLRLCLFIHASTRPSILHPSCRSINTSIRLSVNSSINHPSFHPASLCVHPPSIRASVCPSFILNPSIHLQNKTGVSDGWLVYI